MAQLQERKASLPVAEGEALRFAQRTAALALSQLLALLDATATRTQGGGRSTRECVACERTGVHSEPGRCGCACHTARQLLAELSQERAV